MAKVTTPVLTSTDMSDRSNTDFYNFSLVDGDGCMLAALDPTWASLFV